MLERRIRIVNPLGLHARAAAKLVKVAAKCKSSVLLKRDSAQANAASILSILALAAAYGTVVEILVEGPDEEEAMAQIEELFVSGFGEI